MTLSSTSDVGPAVSGFSATSAPSPARTSDSADSASQTVTGVVQSSSAVNVSEQGQVTYSGTEPAEMTRTQAGSTIIVTVTPR